MALEKIIKKILDDAEVKARDILIQAKEEAGRIQAEAEEKVKSLADGIIQAKRASAQQEALRVISLARLEARKAILSARQKTLNQVFSDRRVYAKALAEKTVVLPDKERKEALEQDVYLKILRPEYEVRIAEILFGRIP